MLNANLAAIEKAQGHRLRLVSGPFGHVREEGLAPHLTLAWQSPRGPWLTLHSRRDPAGDAARWAADSTSDHTIVIAAGAGHVVDALLQRPDARVLVLEPDA